jgi:hypothetical protein
MLAMTSAAGAASARSLAAPAPAHFLLASAACVLLPPGVPRALPVRSPGAPVCRRPRGVPDPAQALPRPSSGTSARPTVSAPNPGGLTPAEDVTAVYFTGVSCISASACTAVGYYALGTGTVVTLAERWNGTAWAIQSTPNPRGAVVSVLYGVSCTSASACTAAGDYQKGGTETLVTLAERWNGTAWAIQKTPSPGGTEVSLLYGVSCASASACTAAGYYVTSSTGGPAMMLAEHWNGTAWAVQKTPNPGGTEVSLLYGVSCASASACTAVGYYALGTGPVVTLAERWNGTAWAAEKTPNPSPNVDSQLNGVSCTSASACTAGGYYEPGNGNELTLAERWNGTAWAIQKTPGKDALLEGMSCASAWACTAVGYASGSTSPVPLAERWNGTAWAIQKTPNPGHGEGGGLVGVSCASPRVCTAVGIYYKSVGTPVTLAERWNGTAWTVQKTPNPTGAEASGSNQR